MEQFIVTRVGLTPQEHAEIMSSLSGWETKEQWIRGAVQEKLSSQDTPKAKIKGIKRARRDSLKAVFTDMFDSDRIITISELISVYIEHPNSKPDLSEKTARSACGRITKELINEGVIKRVAIGEYQRV